jgi:hypothetical protein
VLVGLTGAGLTMPFFGALTGAFAWGLLAADEADFLAVTGVLAVDAVMAWSF